MIAVDMRQAAAGGNKPDPGVTVSDEKYEVSSPKKSNTGLLVLVVIVVAFLLWRSA